MLLSPAKLILFRLFMITLGRFAFFSRAFRQVLVFFLIRRKKPGERYVQCSRYFDIRELSGKDAR